MQNMASGSYLQNEQNAALKLLPSTTIEKKFISFIYEGAFSLLKSISAGVTVTSPVTA